jgi:hypothetical protein
MKSNLNTMLAAAGCALALSVGAANASTYNVFFRVNVVAVTNYCDGLRQL